jgi:hypothetical protein
MMIWAEGGLAPVDCLAMLAIMGVVVAGCGVVAGLITWWSSRAGGGGRGLVVVLRRFGRR